MNPTPTIAADDNPVLLPPPNPAKPTRSAQDDPEWLREAALMLIKRGPGGQFPGLDASEREHIAVAVAGLKAEGVGPRQAARMLDRLKSGTGLAVINGGGKSTKRRARLTLVPAPHLRLVTAGTAA